MGQDVREVFQTGAFEGHACVGRDASPENIEDLWIKPETVHDYRTRGQALEAIAVVAAGRALIDHDVGATLHGQGLFVRDLAPAHYFQRHPEVLRQVVQNPRRCLVALAVPVKTMGPRIGFVAARGRVGDRDPLRLRAGLEGRLPGWHRVWYRSPTRELW